MSPCSSDRDDYDRIFPARSAVSIEPPLPPGSFGGSGSELYHQSSTSMMEMTSDSWPWRSQESKPSGPGRAHAPEKIGFYTTRHRHVVTEDGHMIVTGIVGAETLQQCEDEPIHIPGTVQGFGCLVAVREEQEGKILDVRIVSENSKTILGYSPSELFRKGNFYDILSDEQVENLHDHLKFVRDTDPGKDGPEVFSLIVTGSNAMQIKLWCAVHAPERCGDFFICEFELEDDSIFPLAPSADEELPTPADTLSSRPTHEEFLESTMSSSKPLRVLRSARERRGDAAAMEVFSLISQIQDQLASASNLGVFLKIVVGLVKELTGFHRVMVYQFDKAWNGIVVTELVDPTTTTDLYKGLHFPASDIPAQARALYSINKVRLLYDRDLNTARLHSKYPRVPLASRPAFAHTPDSLRAMSPIHLKYLEHMSVRASMSISLTAFGQLWGLISCHAYGMKGMRVSFPIRKMCRLIGETTSRNIERLSYARRLRAREIINTIPTGQNPGDYIMASTEDLKLFDADCGLLNIRDEIKVLGKLENSQEALAMLEYLRIRNFNTVIASQEISKDFPDLKYKPGFSFIAGLLLVPLSSGGQDFVVFFRKPQISHVHWAGNPYEKKTKEGTTAYLEPRASFKIWSETVLGRSREWTEEQIETAAVICLVYGKFIEVWKQKEAVLMNSQLTRLLLANASHEVRTPLNAIINYLEIALEGPLDMETRENLARSHSASKSLIYVINDLLDLTRTEEGRELVRDDVFDILQVVSDAVEMFRADTDRKNLTFEVVEYPGLPALVKGDPVRLRQVITNITANAVKHTTEGGLRIEIWTDGINDGKCDIEIAIEDTGEGISPSKLDTLFGEFEQIHTDTEESDVPAAQDESASFNALSKMPEQKVLGLGLAVVARAIRNMNGQLRLKSEEGKGSRFTICVPFVIPFQESPSPDATQSGDDTTLPVAEGEVTLVQPASNSLSRPPSIEFSPNPSASQIGEEFGMSLPEQLGSSLSSAAENSDLTHHHSSHNRSAASPLSSPDGSPPTPFGASISEMLEADASTGRDILEDLPIRPVRVPNENGPISSGAAVPLPSPSVATPPQAKSDEGQRYTILVAEDDPINSKIMKKRLEKMGHVVAMTVNGEECMHNFEGASADFDVVLMDMQMPIMSGSEATIRIRAFESNRKEPLPARHSAMGRVPIFAVSASLSEDRRMEYLANGFDGWILKPVDFGRLAKLLEGIRSLEARKAAEYAPGQWERGGWFVGSSNGPDRRGDAADP
ncbi:putative cyanobacterial phytochrome B [Sphaerosporella brunnea]|uniref:Putative cyanobacterial phytochrome B n=1 Tax=Sphaerosporella brunnea TaxID=1250544 RepID=A0A5J5F359_9PEZI|nr:putative cyanobacterial phytochrome B [Sphaerosporella brunnea]